MWVFFRNASDAIGQVTSCNEAQLIAWSKLAKLAFGNDVTTWDVTTIESVGIVLGSFSFNMSVLLFVMTFIRINR